MRIFRLLSMLAIPAVLATGAPGAVSAQAADARQETSPQQAAANPEDQFPASLKEAFARVLANMMAAPAQARGDLQTAENIAQRIDDPQLRAVALAKVRWLDAEAHWRTNDAAGADPLVADGLRLIASISGPLKLRADLYITRGTLRQRDDQAAAALSDFQQAYRIYQQLGERRSQAIALQSIGTLYWAANDSSRAERYYRQASETYDGDPALSLSLHNRRGNVLLALERYAEAEREYRLAIDAAREMKEPLLEARILGNLARNQAEWRKLDEADQTLAQGFALIRGSDAGGFRQQLLATQARVAYYRENYPRARELIRQAFAGVDLTDTSLAFREAHLYAYMIYSKTGEPARALEHLEALQRLTTEAAKVATTTNAALMAARFDYANQELRIANLKADELRRTVEYEKSRARWQRIIFYGLGGATLIVIVLLSVGLFTIRRSRNEVRAANADLASTNVALEKALAAKTEFLATTSHEIRTPLNGILGMTQVMLSDSQLDETMRDRIGVVHGAGMTMRALVDDILDLAKMETGNLTVEAAPMNLKTTLRDVSRMWQEQAVAKGVAFELDVDEAPEWIISDAGRLRQIVFNLLSNALKFTSQGKVSLSARQIAEEPGDAGTHQMRISVSDTGIGIPQDKCEEIFESFKQVDAGTTRRFGGTGLGLSICRNLARALGGEVSVSSVEGQGSTFSIDLPFTLAEAPAGESKQSAGNSVLVLDRNPIARSAIRTVLAPFVSGIGFAASPDEALAALAEGGVGQLFVDEATLKAGGDNPMETLKSLTETGVPTTILWAAPDADMRAALEAAGAREVVQKPLRGETLIGSLVLDVKQIAGKSGNSDLVSHAA
ncbi:ATP-binding protein [Sphingosinithalassobacter portus]|uniref:ATP-binding protein n=1 Tax=Stakelama portus TaxID=2676234 RepID=UPI000D6E3082|nr:ATP-binding protein [Sphingosinithalassobacter portus]